MMDDLKTEAMYYKQFYEAECKLNDNLLRVMRERANAQRGLTPKATHPGYVVLSSQQTVYHDSLGRQGVLWRTSVQTPYSTSLSLETLSARFSADRPGILSRLRISESDMDHTTMRADYRTGLWEIQLYHVHPCVVPAEMLPRKH